MRHLFTEQSGHGHGVHESKTTQMRVDVSFPEVSPCEGGKADCLFNQPVKGLLISELTALSAANTLSPQGLAARAQDLNEIRLLRQGRVLQRREDKMPQL